jgi:predicted DNA-binding transcriptional regulator YafY
MFTQKELATILVGLSFVKSQVDSNLVSDAEGVELKIKNVLPADLMEFMSTFEDRMVVAPYMNFGMEKTKGGNWYDISRAISNNRRIMFRYESRKDDILTLRKLDPYLLVFFQDHWNLIGYSHKRDGIRNFLLERISNVQLQEEVFDLPDSFDTRQLIFNQNENAHFISIKVEESAVKRFKSYLPAPVQNEQSTSDGTTIEFQFNSLQYLNRWLLQFGDEISVLKPSALKKKREKLLKKMLKV